MSNFKHKYNVQKSKAKQRNIDWHFTYDTWLEWWGNDIHKRGKSSDSLLMCRFNDIGPYHPDNVYKGTQKDSCRDRMDTKSFNPSVLNKSKQKPIMTEHGKFSGIREATRQLGCSFTKVYHRVHSPNYPDWYFI